MSASWSCSCDAVETDGPRGQPPRELLTVGCRAIGDGGDTGTAREQVARGQLAHLAGADQHDTAVVEVVEHLLRERSGSRRDRGRTLADRGLDPRPPTGMERLPEDPVQQRTRRSRLEGGPDLAEDLALAGHERIEPCSDAEEVKCRRLVGEPVEDRDDLVPALPRQRTQGLRRARLELAILLGRDVDLGAVARREHHGLVRAGE